MSLPSGRHARGRLRIQNMPFVLAAGTFGANHWTALFGPPTTCNTSQCTYRWRIQSGDRWPSQPSRNHGTRCARSNSDVVVAGFEILPPRGMIRCDCEGLSPTAAASEVPVPSGDACSRNAERLISPAKLPLQQRETHTDFHVSLQYFSNEQIDCLLASFDLYRITDASSKLSRGLRGWSLLGSP